MQQHRTRHSAAFKANVTLAALSESKTLAEFATEYQVHPTQITLWKQNLIEMLLTFLAKAKIKKSTMRARWPNFITLSASSRLRMFFCQMYPG